MKSFNRTISVLVFVNLVMTSFALGEKATEQDVLLTQVQQLNNPFLEIVPAEPLTYQLDRERMQASIAKFVASETVLVIPTPETIRKARISYRQQ